MMQKKQKIKAMNLRRSITISNPKRKELASLKQLFFLRILQLIDTRLPDSNARELPLRTAGENRPHIKIVIKQCRSAVAAFHELSEANGLGRGAKLQSSF
ncbi:hypothetical protein [Flavobacterium wongokense]|uniref:hypothetical protein n=1 Tax=Flavobacterium wongokense TaxID=2910674 RepID=UPI001F48F309|nr:hypothetical protein [Flavobacterium sp. WG47]MCF6130884.1 hypothetical protein [Flavobacterium sp. WG47]